MSMLSSKATLARHLSVTYEDQESFTGICVNSSSGPLTPALYPQGP